VVATETVSLRERASLALGGVCAEALVLVVAIPIIFVHVKYQPKFHLGVSSTTVGVELSDFAVLAIVVAGAVAGVRHGFGELRRGAVLWGFAAAFFFWVVIELAIPYGTDGYPGARHAVTAAKYFEYALLAPAIVLLIRGIAELKLLVGVLTAWSVVASTAGLAQFFGAKIFFAATTGGRQPSFLGFHDFASLSTVVLLVAAATIALPQLGLDKRIRWIAAISGIVGVAISAAIAAVLGIAAASIALLVVAFVRREAELRRLATAGVVIALAVAGAVGMRNTDLGQYLGFLHHEREQNVQTYAHRTVLAYIGYRMWRDHPVAGVGWEASGDPSRFMHYVPIAKQKFPTEPPLVFPSPTRLYGVQNLYVQALADLGVVGFLLLAAVFLSAVGLAARRIGAAIGVTALLWVLAVGGLWTAEGIVAGLPLDALTWIALGLAARG
jgi:O-antigen ligase